MYKSNFSLLFFSALALNLNSNAFATLNGDKYTNYSKTPRMTKKSIKHSNKGMRVK